MGSPIRARGQRIYSQYTRHRDRPSGRFRPRRFYMHGAGTTLATLSVAYTVSVNYRWISFGLFTNLSAHEAKWAVHELEKALRNDPADL